MIKISVIIPVYNAKELIKPLLEAINHQSYKDFEIIFVDDCSTDGTYEFLDSFVKNVTYETQLLKLDKNSGPGKARNIGIMKAKGEWCSFVDADDFFNETYLEDMINAASSATDVVIATNFKFYLNGKKIEKYNIDEFIKNKHDREYLVCNLDWGPWGKIFKKKLWINNKLIFPSDIRSEDGAVIPVLYYKANSIAFAKSAEYYYYQIQNSRSRNDGKFFNDIFTACMLLKDKIDNECIMEYKFARLVGYGVIMNAILNKQPNNVLRKYSNFLKDNYPKGLKNKYIKQIDWRKRFFINLTYHHLYVIQRLLVKIAK